MLIYQRASFLSSWSAGQPQPAQAKMALQDGFLHGDLHPGNLFIQLHGTLEDGGCGTNSQRHQKNGMNSWYMNLIHGMNYGRKRNRYFLGAFLVYEWNRWDFDGINTSMNGMNGINGISLSQAIGNHPYACHMLMLYSTHLW